MTVVPDCLGSYPNFFFDVKVADLDGFVSSMGAIVNAAGFRALAEKYGVRRSSPRFWETADWLQSRLVRSSPIEAGLLDLNRYDDY